MSAKSKKNTARNKSALQNPLLIGLVGLAVVILVVAGVWLLGGQDSGQAAVEAGNLPQFVTAEQAYELQQAGAFVLDVRTPEEWNDYHAPGTTLIPLDQLPNRLAELPTDQDIVVVCRSGNRSQTARDILMNAGFSSVASMNGGLLDWRAEGFPTVSGP